MLNVNANSDKTMEHDVQNLGMVTFFMVTKCQELIGDLKSQHHRANCLQCRISHGINTNFLFVLVS